MADVISPPDIWKGHGDQAPAWQAGYGTAMFQMCKRLDEANSKVNKLVVENSLVRHEVEVWRDQLDSMRLNAFIARPLGNTRLNEADWNRMRQSLQEIENLCIEALKRTEVPKAAIRLVAKEG